MARRIFIAADIDENIKETIFGYSSNIFSDYVRISGSHPGKIYT